MAIRLLIRRAVVCCQQMLERYRCSAAGLPVAFSQLPGQRVAGATGRTVDGDIKIGVGFLDDHAVVARQWDLNLAAFVCAAAWPIDIGESHGDRIDVVVSSIERKAEAPLGVLAQAVGQVLAQRVFHFEVVINCSLPLAALLGGALLVMGVGWLSVRRLLEAPPLEALRA